MHFWGHRAEILLLAQNLFRLLWVPQLSYRLAIVYGRIVRFGYTKELGAQAQTLRFQTIVEYNSKKVSRPVEMTVPRSIYSKDLDEGLSLEIDVATVESKKSSKLVKFLIHT